MINDNYYYIRLNRLDICDLILALGLIASEHTKYNKWQELHDDIKKQMESYDTWYIATHQEDFKNE